MILKTDNLLNFIDFFDKTLINGQSKCILKFIQPIEEDFFNFASLTINNESTNYFYWDNPELQESFIAIEECWNNNETIPSDEISIFSNQNDYSLEKVPDFIISSKFPNNKNDNLWEDYENNYIFIPKLIFYKKNNQYFLAIFFEKKNNKTYLKIIEDFEKYLIYISSFKTKKFEHFVFDISHQTEFNQWAKMINFSLKKIEEKKIKKVVLSRLVSCDFNFKPDLTNLTSKLKVDYPLSYIFVYKRKGSIFWGASPEKLFSINNNLLETEALAGTIARGESNLSDKELGNNLIEDAKELLEHKNVVDYIVKNLTEIATDIEYQNPTIKKLKYVQHLWTPIKAKLKPNYSIESIIKKLHPTPAVCGDPKDEAIKIIDSLESFNRGMFTGLLGWYNKIGYSEVAVAIRSALIKNNKLLLFAGCGIVEGSTPEKEFMETELKLKSIISLFENEIKN